jgi:hypothetical protein
MIRKLDRNLIALFSALTIVACRGDDPGGTATESSTSSSSSESASSTATPTTTDATSSTSDGTSSTSTSTSTDPTTGACGGFIGCNTSTGDVGPQPNGADCSSDADCESMNCYSNQLIMLSICAECNEDADCVAAGTGTACTLDLGTQSISCTNGANGSTCMSDEACMSGHCDAVINIPIPGLLPDTCGECSSSADCTAPDICSPNFDFQAFSGQKICVAPGSVENNNLCPEGAEGDLACMSGHCTMATIMNLVPVNICGECASDADCAMGQTCMPAEASMNGLNGSTCV